MTRRYERLASSLSILRRLDDLDDPEQDVEYLYRQIVETIAFGLGAENCSLMLTEEGGDRLELKAAYSPLEEESKTFGPDEERPGRFRLGEGIVGTVAETGCSIRIDDTKDNEAFIQSDTEKVSVRSLMCFPVYTGGDMAGAMNLSHSKPNMFTVESENMMTLISGRISRLLANHTLHRQLRESETHYRLITEHAGDAIVLFDTRGLVTSANAAIEGITGLPPADFIDGKADWELLIEAEDRESFSAHRGTALLSKSPMHIEYKIADTKGKFHSLEQHSSRFLDDDGKVIGLVSVIRDLTERKKAEENLRRSEELNRRIMEALPGGIVHVSREGGMLSANAQGLEFLGLTEDELSTVNTKDFQTNTILEDGSPCPYEEYPVAKAFATGEPQGPLTIGVKRRDGETRWGVFTAVPVTEPATGELNSCVVTFLDITDRKREEADRREFDSQMQHAQKLESLGVLAGGAAHDFNNLLVGILGSAASALKELPLDSPIREQLAYMESAAKRAADLSKQLMAYSGQGEFQTQSVNLSELIEEMRQLMEVAISKDAKLDLDMDPGLPLIEADATQLRQIVMNLVTNASQALKRGRGSVRVRTGAWDKAADGQENAPPLIGDLKSGPCVFLEVSDTGTGLSENAESRIFDPFFTTKAEGRGLGLAVVLGIVRGHGGAIRVDSEAGTGTTFTVLLPVGARGSDPDVEPGDTPEEWRGSGLVLIVDDDENILTLASEMLSLMGFDTLCATDGKEGIKLFRKHAENLRGVLLDVMMPGMSGKEVFLKMKKIAAHVPVLLSSSFDEEDLNRSVAGKGFAGYIQKPYELVSLRDAFREALADRS